jgi:hypothetical protein
MTFTVWCMSADAGLTLIWLVFRVVRVFRGKFCCVFLSRIARELRETTRNFGQAVHIFRTSRCFTYGEQLPESAFIRVYSLGVRGGPGPIRREAKGIPSQDQNTRRFTRGNPAKARGNRA